MTHGQSAYDLELQGQQHQIQQHLQEALMTQTIRAMMGQAVPPPTRQPPTQNIRPAQYQMGPVANPIPSPGIQQFSMAQLQQMQHNASYMSNLALSQHHPATQQQRSRPRQRTASKNSIKPKKLDKVQKKPKKKNTRKAGGSLGYQLANLSLSDNLDVASQGLYSPRSVGQSSVSSIASSTHTSVSQSSTLPQMKPINPFPTQTSAPQTAPQSSINATVNRATVSPRNPFGGLVGPLQNLYTGQSYLQSYLQQRLLWQSALQNNFQTVSSLVPKYNPFPLPYNILQPSKFTLPPTISSNNE